MDSFIKWKPQDEMEGRPKEEDRGGLACLKLQITTYHLAMTTQFPSLGVHWNFFFV